MTPERVIQVAVPEHPYEVRIGRGLIASVGGAVAEAASGSRAMLISDSNVALLYGERVAASLDAAGVEPHRAVLPPGESSKNWSVVGSLLEEAASAGLERTDAVVALGGGVIGDLAGLVAATYLRGVPYVQVPTSLLAQVDSSVGGKTAVDLSAGKNLAGAFWQPSSVIADTETLASLPDSGWADGMAEVVKTAFLAGDPFLSWLEANIEQVRAGEGEAVTEAVAACVAYKADVVSADERETGGREQLNLGHTYGHALERLEHYVGVSHGVAVAQGLRFAAELAGRVTDVEAGWAERQGALVDAARIARPPRDHDAAAVIDAMRADKKARGGVIRFVLSKGPGSFDVLPIEDDVLAQVLSVWDSGVPKP